MSVFLDSTGFKPKTLTDIRQEYEASYRSVFGSGVDLSPEGPLGQQIAILSKRDADIWEGAQEYYTSRDPDQATGEALDNLAADKGLARLPPTSARADGILCWMPLATAVTIPAGSRIKAASSPTTYSLESEVLGTLGAAAGHDGVRLKLDPAFADGDIMQLVVNMTTTVQVLFDVGTHGTIDNFIGVFGQAVEAAVLGTTASFANIGGVKYLEVIFPTRSSVDPVPNFGLLYTTASMQGMIGSFVADVPGAATVPSYSLDTISTPVANWLGVSQPVAGTEGTDTETDTALRLRIKKTMRTGTGTEDAMYNALLRVPGVAYASVTSNRYLNTDTDGRPGKSVECVVQGGDKLAVATAIWKTAPAGILMHGSFTGTDIPSVIGADGLPHPVNFSVPEAVFAHVRVTVSQRNGEEPSPADLTRGIQDAIVSWASDNMGLGDNMVLQKFYGPVYSVPSIAFVTLEHALTATDGAPVTWVTTPSLDVAAREYATFSASRVVVVIS